MKDYEKGMIDSIYSVDQSDAPSAHMNTMPKIKYRQPPIRPALKKTDMSKSSSKNASPSFRAKPPQYSETPSKFEMDESVGL